MRIIKLAVLVFISASLLSLVGCGVAKDKYEALFNEKIALEEKAEILTMAKDALKEEYDNLLKEKMDLETQLETVSNEKNALKGEYDKILDEKIAVRAAYDKLLADTAARA